MNNLPSIRLVSELLASVRTQCPGASHAWVVWDSKGMGGTTVYMEMHDMLLREFAVRGKLVECVQYYKRPNMRRLARAVIAGLGVQLGPHRLLRLRDLEKAHACVPAKVQFAYAFGAQVMVTMELIDNVWKTQSFDWQWCMYRLLSVEAMNSAMCQYISYKRVRRAAIEESQAALLRGEPGPWGGMDAFELGSHLSTTSRMLAHEQARIWAEHFINDKGNMHEYR